MLNIGGLLRLSGSFTPDLPIDRANKMLGEVHPDGTNPH